MYAYVAHNRMLTYRDIIVSFLHSAASIERKNKITPDRFVITGMNACMHE